MGAPDQFAKTIFALDTAEITGGAMRWEGPKEIGLTEVRLDGLLSVQAHGRLASLPLPWRDADRHADVGLEVKMPGDHLDPLAVWRAELRRAAWQVRRADQEEAGWEGSVGFWTVAPHVPDVLRRLRSLHAVGPGCYAVGAPDSHFLWVAANELPLDDALIPFLIARSGKALVEMARWVVGRRPPGWVFRRLLSVAMDQASRLDILRQYPIEHDPQLTEQREWIMKEFLRRDPELRERILEPARAEEREKAREDARRSLRQVLGLRGFALTPEQDARIGAQSDLDLLHRWREQAITAGNADEALA